MNTAIFWDTMLFIYLLEGKTTGMAQKVGRAFEQSLVRGDQMTTSCLAVGEVTAGTESLEKRAMLEAAVRTLGFKLLPFDEQCIAPFGALRARNVAVADSIHLACAAAHHIDLFLTEDKALHKLHVPGIKFIADLQCGLF